MKFPKSNPMKGVIVLLAMLTIMSPIFLLWHVEISMDFKPDTYLDNGFVQRAPIQAYHLWIYATLISSVATVCYVLMTLDTVFGIGRPAQ